MDLPGTVAVALAVGAAIYLAVTAYVWRHRRAVGGRALTLLLLSAAGWTILSAVEASMADPQVQEHWGDAKYLGIVGLPPALLVFALEYTGRRRRAGRRWVLALAVEPVVVLALLAVPPTHDWVRSVPPGAEVGEFAFAQTGPAFWVHLVYSYLLIVVAIAVLVLGSLRASRGHARQASILIASVLLPLAVNAAYNLGVPLLGDVDPTPIGFSITAFVLVWGFFRFRLLELVPVGRRQVVDQIPDAVVVLNARGIVVDVNPAAGMLAGCAASDMVGRDLVELLPALAPITGSGDLTEHVAGACVVPTSARGPRDLTITISPLPDDVATPTGRLVVLHDVTAQRDVERRLRELVDERQETIDTLQRGLYPTRLPRVPGVDVAAALDAAEAETNIGGDFVDVRPNGEGRWTLMIGDVVGKGAGAATLTALARHTTLALTAIGWEPSRVLGAVSAAIAADEAMVGSGQDPRFCTLALATLVPTPTGADVVLSLGGHPQPLLIAASGSVTEVGLPGSLLGIVDPPELYDVRLQLRPGESLVLFTDGVTETRRDHELFGDERLAELLSGMAGQPAVAVVEAVVRAVRSFGQGEEGRDDVAVLVVAVPAPYSP